MKLFERFERLIALQSVGTELNHPNWRVVAPEVGKAVPVELVAPNVFPQSTVSSMLAALAPDKGQKKPRMAKSAIREFFLRLVIGPFLMVDPLVIFGLFGDHLGCKGDILPDLIDDQKRLPHAENLAVRNSAPGGFDKVTSVIVVGNIPAALKKP